MIQPQIKECYQDLEGTKDEFFFCPSRGCITLVSCLISESDFQSCGKIHSCFIVPLPSLWVNRLLKELKLT